MQQMITAVSRGPAMVKGLVQIHGAIVKGSWKLSGCSLSQGALSCALFIEKYARFQQIGEDVELPRELFDIGCSSLAVEKSSWIDLADLALVCHRFSDRRILEVKPEYFFEDIDPLAVRAMQQAGPLSGFKSPRMGAALYALRRLTGGCSDFSWPVTALTAAITMGGLSAFGADDADLQQKARYGLADGHAAPVLFAAAASELGLLDSQLPITGISWRVQHILSSVNDDKSFQMDLGWHYGELGKAYAVLRAGMAFENKAWIGAAMQILICCAHQILDQGISHLDIASGAAGAALVFQKVHRITGQSIFEDVAARIQWLLNRATLPVDEQNFDSGYSFYHGIAGIGLAIIAGTSPQDQEVEELLWLL